MKNKLLLLEGIPGSGKSWTSRRVSRYLSHKKIVNDLYIEGCRHPVNLEGYVCVPINKVDDIIKKFSKFEKKIREHQIIDGEYTLIARQKVMREDSEIFKFLQQYAIWDNIGYCNFRMFQNLHINSWGRFTQKQKNTDVVSIFECAFLQDHVTELMLFYTMTEKEIINYFNGLYKTIVELSPLVIYLQQKDVAETIARVANVRTDERKGISWADRVADMISNSPYGKANHLNGYNGMVEFFVRRKQVDNLILESLPIKHFIIDNDDYDWDNNFKKIKDIIDSNFSL